MISPWPSSLNRFALYCCHCSTFPFFINAKKEATFIQELDQLITDMKKYVVSGLGCLPLYNNDKLSQLSETFNSMTKLMDGLIEEERNAQKTKNDLITNVSHHLAPF